MIPLATHLSFRWTVTVPLQDAIWTDANTGKNQQYHIKTNVIYWVNTGEEYDLTVTSIQGPEKNI